MRRDPTVCIFGEDVAEAGTPFKVLSGLVAEFGKERVIDTPISEAGFTGVGVGAAMTGLRPVVDIMFGDFITLTMDQMVNQAAKVHYMSGGKWKVPMVMRTTLGATVGGTALAIAACVVQPCSGAESGSSLNSL
jgi:pyruvate dehydrogenase E1 component beta subunit